MKITKNKLIIAALIVIVAVYFNQEILEAFKSATEHFRGRRFFWGYNPTTRNMTYDIRHDRDVRNKYAPKEAGAFNQSGIHPNYQD